MKYTPGSIESTGHVLLTGPVTGTVELEDGTVVDVSAPVIEVDPDQADEISFLIGEHWVEHGHPDDVEPDPETGELVQRPFVHVHDERFDEHPGKFQGEPAGIPAEPTPDTTEKG